MKKRFDFIADHWFYVLTFSWLIIMVIGANTKV